MKLMVENHINPVSLLIFPFLSFFSAYISYYIIILFI